MHPLRIPLEPGGAAAFRCRCACTAQAHRVDLKEIHSLTGLSVFLKKALMAECKQHFWGDKGTSTTGEKASNPQTRMGDAVRTHSLYLLKAPHFDCACAYKHHTFRDTYSCE